MRVSDPRGARHGGRARRRPGERGIALVLVVWVFMILGVLALDFSRYIRESASASLNFAEEAQGYYLALAGMNRVVYRLAEARQEGRATAATTELEENRAGDLPAWDGTWQTAHILGGTFEVRVTDEEGLFPINQFADVRRNPGGDELLRRLISGIVLGPQSNVQGRDRRTSKEIDAVVDAILDWVDVDRQTRANGAEDKYYLGLNPPYRPKNGYFESPEELLLVRGVTPELYYGTNDNPGLRDLISVDSQRISINPNTAPPVLLGILLGKDADGLAALEAARGASPDSFAEELQAQAVQVGLPPTLFAEDAGLTPGLVKVEARADTSRARNRAHVLWVVDISDGPGEYHTRRWVDRAPWTGGLPDTGPPEDVPS